MSAALAHSNPGAVSDRCAGKGGGPSSPPNSITFLTLPAPPSANALFCNVPGVGRVKTKLYSDWRGHAGWRLLAQHPAPVGGPVVILIGIERTSLLADADNRIKATFDLLVEHRVIADDRFVVGFAAAWSPKRDGLMRLAIIPAADIGVRFQLAEDGAHGGWFMNAPHTEEGDA